MLHAGFVSPLWMSLFSCFLWQRPHIFDIAWAKQAGSWKPCLNWPLKEMHSKHCWPAKNFCLFNMIKITCHSSSNYQKINCYAGTVHLYSLEEIFCMFAGTCQLWHNTSVCATWMDVRNFLVCGCVVTHLALHIKVFFFPAFYCRVFGCKNGCVMNMWPCFWVVFCALMCLLLVCFILSNLVQLVQLYPFLTLLHLQCCQFNFLYLNFWVL